MIDETNLEEQRLNMMARFDKENMDHIMSWITQVPMDYKLPASLKLQALFVIWVKERAALDSTTLRN